MTLFDRAGLDAAVDVVGRYMQPTPQFAWPMLVAEAGAEVWVKHENHTPTGAFKVRGGLVYLDRLQRERRHVSGIISATRGNHGQSLAFAGRAHDVPVTVVVPRGNDVDKNAAMQAFGAEVIEFGGDFQEASERAVELSGERGFEMVPAFHPDLVTGVATYALEFLRAVPRLDTVYVPVGMGSGICAFITVRDLLGLDTEIVGVVADGADATKRSFEAGHVVTTDAANTFVDGVATRSPNATAIDIIVGGAARVVSVSDEASAEAMRLLWRTTHNLPEPAGAIGAAALMSERALQEGRCVGVVMTGGNVNASMLSAVLVGETPGA